jgi:MerR family mercuric resistance operon transcriptional regulator
MTNSKRTIGKLAAEAGVGVEKIRYYERRGLLQQPPRHGTARNYGDEALWRLRYIKVGRQWGLSLREMRNLLAGAERSPNFCSSIRAAAAQRIEAIEHQIAELATPCAQLDALWSSSMARGSSKTREHRPEPPLRGRRVSRPLWR